MKRAIVLLAALTLAVGGCASETEERVVATTADAQSSADDPDTAGSDTAGSDTAEPTDDVATTPEPALVESEPTPTVPVVVPEGFSTVTVEVTKADGEVCEVCMWLADTADERARGLMDVTDLGRAEGMAFLYERPTSGSFYMFQTITPLSIAWFGADGTLVSTADMEPCLSDDASDCDRFGSGGEFVLAVEVFRGELESIGITDGATARVLPGTEASDCPLT